MLPDRTLALLVGALLCGQGAAQTPAPPEPGPAAAPERSAPATPGTTPGTARPQESSATARNDLASARSLFGATDRDGNGALSEDETAAAGLSRQVFQILDHDVDGAVSLAEFVVGYRQALAEARRPVAADLEAEATRLLALRKTRALETRKQRVQQEAARGADAPGLPAGPAARRLAGRGEEPTPAPGPVSSGSSGSSSAASQTPGVPGVVRGGATPPERTELEPVREPAPARDRLQQARERNLPAGRGAPGSKQPVADEPAAEKPAAGKPAAEKPAAEKPAAEKPAAEKPATEKPAAQDPRPAPSSRVPRRKQDAVPPPPPPPQRGAETRREPPPSPPPPAPEKERGTAGERPPTGRP